MGKHKDRKIDNGRAAGPAGEPEAVSAPAPVEIMERQRGRTLLTQGMAAPEQPAPEPPVPEEPSLEDQVKQIESVLGTIHATRAADEAEKKEPIKKVQDGLTAALDQRRGTVEMVQRKWAFAVERAKQVASLDRALFPYTDVAEQTYRAATRAAKVFLNAVTEPHVTIMEREIARLHSEAQLRGGYDQFILNCITSLDGLEARAAESFRGMVQSVNALQKYAKKPISTDSAKFPEDGGQLPRPEKGKTDFNVFDY